MVTNVITSLNASSLMDITALWKALSMQDNAHLSYALKAIHSLKLTFSTKLACGNDVMWTCCQY